MKKRTALEKIIIVLYYIILVISIIVFVLEITSDLGMGVTIFTLGLFAFICLKAKELLSKEQDDNQREKFACISNVMEIKDCNTESISKVKLQGMNSVNLTIDNYFNVTISLEKFLYLYNRDAIMKLDKYLAEYIDTNFSKDMHKMIIEAELEKVITNFLDNLK